VAQSPPDFDAARLRIMQVHNWYRSATPSGENQVLEREGRALTERGHEVIRFDRHSDEIEQWPALRKAALPGQIVWSREARRDLRADLRSARPDVVHIHNTFPLLSPSVLYACRDERVPTVITLHNYRLLCAGGSFFRDGAICRDCVSGPAIQAVRHGCYKDSRLATAPVALSNALHRQAWRKLVSAYIFISAAQRDLLAELDLPPERVFVRHNLIPRRPIRQADPEHSVLYAGRLDEAKGIRILMAGWDLYLRNAGENPLGLVVAGTGTLQAEVAAWAVSRPSVRLAGHVGDDQAARLMSRSRAVILPSTWAEPFGLVAVEAMAAGTPCIASDHAALPELITHGVDGTLVPPGNPGALAAAIADVQARPATYAGYGQAARETYEKKFDPRQNVDQLLGIYRYAMAHPVAVPRKLQGLR
jgi:glycosyltransferase involved in cell wall biosynthesis